MNDAIKVAHSNPGLGAYMAYLALQGASTQDIYEGAGEGIVNAWNRGYHKCLFNCMVTEKLEYWVPPFFGLLGERIIERVIERKGANLIAKGIHYVKPPKNLGQWQRLKAFGMQRTAGTVKMVGRAASWAGVALFAWETYECAEKCVNKTIYGKTEDSHGKTCE